VAAARPLLTRSLLSLGLVLAALAQAKEPVSFRRQVGEAEVDWSAGTITAQAGAAADLRMPNPNAARPGAERRARAAAEDRLRAALRQLVPGGKLDDRTALARVSRTEYQSNGGVVLWLTLAFADLAPGKPAPVALRVASMPFALAPVVVGAGKTAVVAHATYKPAADCPKDAIATERDGQGRLVLAGSQAKLVDSLAGAAVVIYLERPQP
jgi:hypothetical protein